MSTFDVAAIQIDASGNVTQVLADQNNKGTLVTGAPKIVQRFLILLLTRKGIVPYLPNFGSKFVDLLIYGGVRTETEVFSAFSAAQTDIVPALQAAQLTTDPPSEQFVRAKLTGVVVTVGAVKLNIAITTNDVVSNITLPLVFTL